MDESQAELLREARRAALEAYAPYSRFRVGAAVVAEGRVYTGFNIENASSNLGICAERAAISHARLHGAVSIEGIAIACIDADIRDGNAATMPCGGCRQWMVEHMPHGWVVIDGHDDVTTVQELMPRAFRLGSHEADCG